MEPALPVKATDPAIVALAELPSTALRQQWRTLYGKAPPPKTSREILLLGVAYRLQEEKYGGLSPATRQRLDRLAAAIRKDPDTAITDAVRIKPGTRLLRDWHGEHHEVTVLEDGFAWAGKRYASLSEIARLITGTRWNGWAFFGLKGRRGAAGRRATSTGEP